MKLIVVGACGRMGSEVRRLLSEGFGGHSLAASVDISGGEGIFTSLSDVTEPADAVIDFSHHSAVVPLLDAARQKRLPVVVATTGHNEAESAAIRGAAEQIPVFWSANMSLGIALLIELAVKAAKVFPDADIEIVEKHHNRKLDAPSGTALMLADAVAGVRKDTQFVYGRAGQHKREKSEIGIHSLRMGNIIGEHEVILCTDTQTVTLSHEAHSRSLFAEGALAAASFLAGKEAGLYSMQDMIRNEG